MLLNDVMGADALQSVVFDSTAAQYGSFTVDADGKWSYELDSSLAAVQALGDGDTLTESFTYTITDADGDSSTATLTITIKGQTDSAPVVTPEDADGNVTPHHNHVTEGTGESVSGTVTVSAQAGIAGVTVGGQDISQASSSNPVSITTTG